MDPFKLGVGFCDLVYSNKECGYGSGDCLVDGYPDCHVDRPHFIGNGICDEGKHGGSYDTEVYGYDGGDRLLEDYPDCHVDLPLFSIIDHDLPNVIGDGF